MKRRHACRDVAANSASPDRNWFPAPYCTPNRLSHCSGSWPPGTAWPDDIEEIRFVSAGGGAQDCSAGQRGRCNKAREHALEQVTGGGVVRDWGMEDLAAPAHFGRGGGA